MLVNICPLFFILLTTISLNPNEESTLTINHIISVENDCKTGSYINITIELAYTGVYPLLSLGIKEIIPPGTSYYGIVDGDAPPHIQPSFGTTEQLDFAWIFPPQMPTSFTYRLLINSQLEAENIITGIGIYGTTEYTQETPPFSHTFLCPIFEGEPQTEGEGIIEGEGGSEGEQTNDVNFSLSSAEELIYSPEETKEIIVTITYPPGLGITALGTKIFIPTSWEYIGLKEGTYLPQIAPSPGTTNELDFAWITIPPSGTRFSFLVKVGPDITPTKEVWGYGIYRILGGQINTPSSNIIFDVGPLPDLVFISGEAFPYIAFDGQLIDVSYIVENTGSLATSSTWTDCIYISNDNVLDESDTLLSCIKQEENLSSGDRRNIHSIIKLPENLTGNFYLISQINAYNNFPELSKNNNEGAIGYIEIIHREYKIKIIPLSNETTAGSQIKFKILTLFPNTEEPNPNKIADIKLSHRFIEKTERISTDENGEYIFSYQPLQTEAGIYTFEAKLPEEIYYPYKSEIILNGIEVYPSQLILPYFPQKPVEIPLHIVNLGDTLENNLSIYYNSLPLNWDLEYQIPENINGNSIEDGKITIYPNSLVDSDSNIEIFIYTGQGSQASITCILVPPPAVPKLEINPPSINLKVIDNNPQIIHIELKNLGGSETGKIAVALTPQSESLSLITGTTIENIKPGESYFISLQTLYQQTYKSIIHESSISLSSTSFGEISIPIRIYETTSPSISLRLTDKITSEPINEGWITVQCDDSSLYSYPINSNGEATIENFQGNIISITCISPGYKPYSFSPVNTKLLEETINISLERIPIYQVLSFLEIDGGLLLKNIENISLHNKELIPELEISPTYIASGLNTYTPTLLSIKNNSYVDIQDILIYPYLSASRNIQSLVRYIDALPSGETIEIPFILCEDLPSSNDIQISGIKYRKLENRIATETFVPIDQWNTESIQSDFAVSHPNFLKIANHGEETLIAPSIINITTQEPYYAEENTSPIPIQFTIDPYYPTIKNGENINISVSCNMDSLIYNTSFTVLNGNGEDITSMFLIQKVNEPTINLNNELWTIVPTLDFWKTREEEIFILVSIHYTNNKGTIKSITSPKIGFLIYPNSNFELHTFFPFKYEKFITDLIVSGEKIFPVGYILKWEENYPNPVIVKLNKVLLKGTTSNDLLPIKLLYSETVNNNNIKTNQLIHTLYPIPTDTSVVGIWDFNTPSEYTAEDVSIGVLYPSNNTSFLAPSYQTYQHDLVKLINLQSNGKLEYAFITNEDQDPSREPDTIYFNTGDAEEIAKVQCNWFTTNDSQLYGIAFQNPDEKTWIYIKLAFPEGIGANFNIIKITDLSGNTIPNQYYWVESLPSQILNLVYPSNSSSGTFYVYFQKNQEENHPPVAVIAQSYTELYRPERLILDGSGSYDEDNDMLSFNWQIVSKPFESLTYLRYSNTPSPLFIADVPGEYIIELVVSDGSLSSEPAYSTINVINRVPQIELQAPTRARPKELVVLDASNSFDPEGDTIEFLWRLTSKPDGSRVSLQNIFYPTISFTPDIKGIYEITLNLSDGYDNVSKVWLVDVYNNLPQINLDYPPQVYLNQNIVISAKDTHDPDDDTLSFNWSLLRKPEGSTVNLKYLDNDVVSFTPDKRGEYEISLSVYDGYERVESIVLIDCINRNPEAILRVSNTEIAHGKEITLDASFTSDPDGDDVTLDWELSSKPIRSSAELYLLSKYISLLKPDAPGLYKVKITASDKYNGIDSDEVVINATNAPPICRCENEYNGYVGSPIYLTCENVEDPENDKIYYQWNILQKPAESNLYLTSNEDSFEFIADKKGSYIVELEVNDEWGASSKCYFNVNIGNQPPLPQIQVLTAPIYVGSPVVITSINSTDPDGDDILTREWRLVNKPIQSNAELTSSSGVETIFIPDRRGLYTLELIVFDGTDWSAPAQIEILTQNRPPIAVITPPETLEVNQPCSLIGVNSFDPDNDEIAFIWSIVEKPVQSKAKIDNPSAENITFVPDYPGYYSIRLIVADDELTSQPAEVTLRTSNLPPIARISAPALTTVGATPIIDGSGSFDPDGDPLTYRWQLISKPPDSQSSLSSLTSVTTSLYIDQPGSYQVALQVSDGKSFSEIAKVFLSTGNVPPIAVANQYLRATIGTPCYLDASQSYDPNYDPLLYLWSLLEKPEGSNAELFNYDTPHPYFIPDVEGVYRVQLIVSDGKLYSKPLIISISTINTPPVAILESTNFLAYVGDTITLSASQSYDPDGDDISFFWTLTSKPESSSATLSNPDGAITSINIDKKGFYEGYLTVKDTHNSSNSIQFNISCNNKPPVILITSPERVSVAEPTIIDASQSYDPDDDLSQCDYKWTLISKPSTSNVNLENLKQLKIVFSPDIPGTYTFEFEIKDPENATEKKSISIEAECNSLTPPKGVSASDGEYPDKIVITWEPSDGAEEYMVFMNTENDSSSAVPISGWTNSLKWEDHIDTGQLIPDNIQDSTNCGCIKGCEKLPNEQTYKETRYYWIVARINEYCVSGFSKPDSGYVEIKINQVKLWEFIKQFLGLY